jgi:tetratricopeptide (TPR) repeat protein
MLGTPSARTRTASKRLAWALALAGCASSLAAQELPLKREPPDMGPFACPAPSEAREPTDEERTQADRLGSSAAQALILGDTERARDLLARATELDPTSAELAYQHGRALENLGAAPEALAQYCRVLELDPESRDAEDVRARLETLTEAGRPDIAPEAVLRFQAGVAHAESGRLDDALGAFREAASAAPAWPDPVYDQGVVLLRLGRRREAATALSRYLELSPGAPDAVVVSQRLGQLQAPVSLPSPGAALGLGLIVPGMGQFYSGRALAGFSVLALAGGAAAAALLIEEVQVRCLDSVPPGEDCPPGRVQSETSDQPYLVPGLAAAGAITLLGAVEAWMKARGRRRSERVGLVTIDLGETRLSALTLGARGRSLELHWVGLRF